MILPLLFTFMTAQAVPSTAPTELSPLPNGITEIKQFPTNDFCRQFLNQASEANGTQLKTGGKSCSSTPIGLLPDVNKMVSSLIIEPTDGATFDASKDNIVAINTRNLDAGFFNDPNGQYYLVPSTLSQTDKIMQGHQHIVVQALGDATVPPDPQKFGFFKGINDQEVDFGRQRLQAIILANTITENGPHRICSMTGSDGHQNAVSPVQKRGPQDDCIRVNVINAVSNGAVGATQQVIENTAIPGTSKSTQ
jgi:hypothetical protein